MTTTVPRSVPDQTSESLLAATWIRNPWPTWADASACVFGSAKTKSHRLVHGGWSDAFQALHGAGYSSPGELVNAHSYLPLFLPLMTAARYEKLQSALLDGKVAKLSALSRLKVIRAAPYRFCHQCVHREIARRGYAVAHRSKQIAGVVVCPEHGVGLVACREPDPAGMRLMDRGLLIPCADDAYVILQGGHGQSAVGHGPAELRYARFVQAALFGQLTPSTHRVRQRAFELRLDKRFQARKTPGSTLLRLIRDGHSADALGEAELDLSLGSNSVWPALVADGPAYAHHPIANLLVMSVLFEGIDDYNQAVAAASRVDQQPDSEPGGLRLGLLQGRISASFVKDCLRKIPLAEVALRHDMELAVAKTVLRQFPRLARHRRHANVNRRRRAHREAALELKRSHSRAARQDLKNLANSDYAWLVLHDREWLDSNFPLKRPPRDRTDIYDVSLDASTAAVAANIVDRLAREGREHVRRTWSLLLGCFDKDTQRILRTGRLPIAARTLRELMESKAQHRDRCLRRIQCHVEANRPADARHWANELLVTHPGDRSVITRVLSCLLPDSSTHAQEVALLAP